MDSVDLEQFINDRGIDAQIVNLEAKTPTVEAAAAAVGVNTDQIGKSLLFLVQGEPLLVIANGSKRIGYKLLAEYLNTNRKRIKFATSAQVEAITGYSIGSVPPFGHKQKLNTLIEEGVMEQDEIYAGGGAINTLMRVGTAELLRVTSASLVSL